MSRSLARYVPSRRYLSLMLVAVCGGLFSAWSALHWSPSWIAAALFALSAVGLGLVAFRPVIEIHDTHLAVGRTSIPWSDIRRVDQTGWSSPLAVYLTLVGERRMLLLYPGNFDSSSSLLRHLRRCSSEALLDGIPYRQFWGEASLTKDVRAQTAAPAVAPAAVEDKTLRYPLLRPEDEDEVERMFQRLKSVGHIDSRSSHEE